MKRASEADIFPGQSSAQKHPRVEDGEESQSTLAFRGIGRVLWYNGRRQTGRVLSDDGCELTIPPGGAMNRNLVPLTPAGLMHGTRVRCMPVRRNGLLTCISVRPDGMADQQGLSCGIDKQIVNHTEDQGHVAAADVADLGFVVGIFDGHGGGFCSAHVAQHFPRILHDVYSMQVQQIPRGVSSLTSAQEAELIHAALRDSFRAAEHDLMRAAQEAHWTDGTSALVALLCHGFEAPPPQVTVPGAEGGVAKLFLAWCGDSRALLLRGDKVLPISDEHIPLRKDEYERVKQAGGKVLDFGGVLKVGRRDKYKEKKSTGAFRSLVWLATTRSFGDIRLKAPYNIVTCEADIKVRTLTPDDWAVVLLCNAITAKLPNRDVADACRTTFAKGGGPVDAAQEVVARARKRGSVGNLTAVVMRLGWSELKPLASFALG